SRRRHTRSYGDWSSDVCSSDLRRMLQCDPFDENVLAAIGLEQVRPQITSFAEDSLAHECTPGNHFLKQSSRLARAGVSLLPSAEIGRASCRERVYVREVEGSWK